MTRTGLLLVALAACGNDKALALDAAPPAIDMAMPDGMTCGAPTKLCGTTCLPVHEDETNCGDCGVECKGGQACNNGACACPPAFVPDMPDDIAPTQFDSFQGSGNIRVGIAPNFTQGSINPVLVGYPSTSPPLNTNIDLSTVPVGMAPFVAAAYRFDLNTMSTDAAFIATAGTLRLMDACSTEVEGRLTNATFRGVLGDIMSGTVTIDPMGCSFTINQLDFHIRTTACP